MFTLYWKLFCCSLIFQNVTKILFVVLLTNLKNENKQMNILRESGYIKVMIRHCMNINNVKSFRHATQYSCIFTPDLITSVCACIYAYTITQITLNNNIYHCRWTLKYQMVIDTYRRNIGQNRTLTPVIW